MQRVIKAVSAIAVLILVLLAGLAAWGTWFLDLNPYRARIESLIARETGLRAELRGPIEHHLLNGLNLSFSDLRLHRGEQPVAMLKRLTLRISLRHLLQRQLIIRRLAIEAESVSIARHAAGAAGPPSAGEATTALPLERVRIEDLRLNIARTRYLDAGNQLDIKLNGLTAQLRSLPIVEHHELLVDDPSWLMGYRQSGQLSLDSLHVNDLRFEAIDSAFSNDRGTVEILRARLRLSRGKAGQTGHVRIDSQGKALLRFHFDEPLDTLPRVPWSSLDRLRLEELSLKLHRLDLDTGAGPIRLRDTVLEAAPLPLVSKARRIDWLARQDLAGVPRQLPLRLRVRGAQLRLPTGSVTDFAMALSNDAGTLQVERIKARLQASGADDAAIKSISAQLAGSARLSMHGGGQSEDPKRLQLVALELDFGQPTADTAHGAYRAKTLKLRAAELPLMVGGEATDWTRPDQWGPVSSGMRMRLEGRDLRHGDKRIESLVIDLARDDDKLVIKHAAMALGQTRVRATGELNLLARPAPWRLTLDSKGVALGPLLAFTNSEFIAEGLLAIRLDLNGRGLKPRHLRENLQGDVLMDGEHLSVDGFDLDGVLTHLQNSQSIGLLDIGAYALAGPAGALLTKGTDYSQLISSARRKGVSRISHMHSHLRVGQGHIQVDDVAIATRLHRLAVKGKLSTAKQGPIELRIATVNSAGCPIYMEEIGGSVEQPTVSKAGAVVKGVINPITSLLGTLAKTIAGGCEQPFYTGQVAAPVATDSAALPGPTLLKGTLRPNEE